MSSAWFRYFRFSHWFSLLCVLYILDFVLHVSCSGGRASSQLDREQSIVWRHRESPSLLARSVLELLEQVLFVFCDVAIVTCSVSFVCSLVLMQVRAWSRHLLVRLHRCVGRASREGNHAARPLPRPPPQDGPHVHRKTHDVRARIAC